MEQLIKITAADFKLIFRDPSLRIFLFLPLLILVLICIILPQMAEKYTAITEYIPYVLMASTTQTPAMFGFIYCFVLIDEKDTQVAKIYGILPVSRGIFTLSRLSIPYFISVLFTWVMLLTQPFFALGIGASLVISAIAALVAPLMTLSIASLSKNKMEGMTWFKIVNTLITIPIVGFFIPKFGYLFGILPSYWAFAAVGETLEKGSPWSAVIATTYLTGLIAIALYRHLKMHFI